MKNILIIGGSHGISLSLANQLRAQGDQVFTASRTATNQDNHQTFDALNPSDLELPDSLDGFVYAPGSITLKPAHRLAPEDMLEEFKLNALGAATTIQQALPALKKSASASIVLFSTVAVQTGLPYHASISMAKGAVEGLTRALAAELSPNIRVNAIAPSLTKTPLADNLINSEAKLKASSDRHPLKTIGNPEDIASLAGFLLSEKAKFISGQIIQADGGMGSLRT